MAFTAWPFDLEPDGETPQVVTEDQFRHTLSAASQSGVDRATGPSATNALQVAALPDSSGVTVQAGRATLHGYSCENDSPVSTSVPENTSSLPRMYRAVLRLDRAASTIEPAVLEGTAASSPVVPSITRTDTIWELPLARFRRSGNNGPISNMQDERVFLNPSGHVLCLRDARPLLPSDGDSAYELDTGRLIYRHGGQWLTAADPQYPTSWTPISLTGGYSNHTAEGATPAYRFLSPGRVELRGSVSRSNGDPIPNNQILGRMPSGARPDFYTRHAVATRVDSGMNTARLLVASVNATAWLPGQIVVTFQSGAGPLFVYLDGVFFDTP